jgi:primosomal protein N' (replication factor Y)
VCGRSQQPATSCPVCGHSELVYKGIGTKALVQEVERLFAGARVARFDSDTTAENSLERQYESINRGNFDILVGTQSLAKGFDFPRLSTLGVIVADSSLQMPDFTSAERTFQLIRQVLGRVARGHRAGRIFVQTYSPDSDVLQAALQDDWTDFYQRELAERQLFKFPPYMQLLQIRCRRKSAGSAEKACQRIADRIAAAFPDCIIDGPAPAFHEKSSSGYTWQLVVKTSHRSTLLDIVDSLPSTVTSYDLDPQSLL